MCKVAVLIGFAKYLNSKNQTKSNPKSDTKPELKLVKYLNGSKIRYY